MNKFNNTKLHEECAVIAVSTGGNEAAGIAYNSLLALQHRGQEGAGIALLNGNKIRIEKNVGLVSEAFTSIVLESMRGSNLAIGHARYSTTGGNTIRNVQPFITEYLTGRLATAHNGNVTNAMPIKQRLEAKGLEFTASSDSEIISALIGFYTVECGNILDGVKKAVKELEGSFTLVILSSENKIIAVRDGHGYRPLCIGKTNDGVAVASESCALDSSGFSFVRDVEPGEIVVIEDGNIVHSEIILGRTNENAGMCIFEYVYFARSDSIIDNLNVYESRFNMGRTLAREHFVDADIVCGVPDSGLEAAAGYAKESGIPLAPGFVKNRYIGRSFIFPTQAQRENAVQLKLNPLKTNIEGKRIVLVDDSIVRGTTSEKIVKALKNAGAKEVHMRVSSPPFKFTCHYGTDIDDAKNLIANKMSLAEVGKKIGADSLEYISVQGLKAACAKCNLPFCTECFTGTSIDNLSKLQFEKR